MKKIYKVLLGIIGVTVTSGLVLYFVLNIDNSKNNGNAINNGTNNGTMIGTFQNYNGNRVELNEIDKSNLLNGLSKNKNDEIHVTYSGGSYESMKLALFIRDFLVSKEYKVAYPEQVYLGSGICVYKICFANEGKSIHVN